MRKKVLAPDIPSEAASVCPTLIGIDELASILHIRKGTIYNWVYRRKIPYVKVGRLVRFDLKEIAKYLDGCRIDPLAGKG
jgi:excisionase family DNA binding protein